MNGIDVSKDYYGKLGVKRDSSADEIKSAYRKLAKEHHPDTGGGDEDVFKEVSEAYEVLSDPEKRAGYDNSRAFSGAGMNFVFGDMMGFVFNQNMDMSRRGGPRNLRLVLSVSMREAYTGCTKKVTFERTRHCTECKGMGMVATSSSDKKCPSCHGTGFRYGVSRVPCQACGGAGKSGMVICAKCNWHGHTRETVSLQLNIPPKTKVGSVFRVEGEGNVDSTGTGGQVMIELTYPPREGGFTVDMNGNLRCSVAIPWHVALSDSSFTLDVLAGSDKVEVVMDGKKRSDHVYEFPGRGLGGSLMVKVVHVLPENMDEKDRKAVAAILEKYANTKAG